MKNQEETKTSATSTHEISTKVFSLGVHPQKQSLPDDNGNQSDSSNVVRLPDHDDKINQSIAVFQDRASDWEYNEIARKVHEWIPSLWDTLIPATWRGHHVLRLTVLVCFARTGQGNLGHYRPGRNDSGFKWEINLNARTLGSRSEVQLASTVLHELLHCVGRPNRHTSSE